MLRFYFSIAFILLGAAVLVRSGDAQGTVAGWKPEIPKTWQDDEIAALELPLAHNASSPKHISADYYYQIPIRPIYKSYPIYAPGKEPAGYLERLKRMEPKSRSMPRCSELSKTGSMLERLSLTPQLSSYRAAADFRGQRQGVVSEEPGSDNQGRHLPKYAIRSKGEGESRGRYSLLLDVPHSSDARREHDKRGAGKLS